MEGDIEPGKLFVGGLSWETTKEGLKKYFEQWGEVTDSVIMTDSVTKNPRGFGFVTYSSPASVQEALRTPEHMLDNKKIDPKPATTKGGGNVAVPSSAPIKKIFVGGLNQETTEEDLRSHFQKYGTVTEVDLKYDRATSRQRGFGFVGFDNEDAVEKAVQVHYHHIKDKSVEVKKAQPRMTGGQGQMYGQGHGGGSMRYGQGATAGYGQTYPPQYFQGQQQQQQQQQQYPYGYSQYNTAGGGYAQYGGQAGAYGAGYDQYGGGGGQTTGSQAGMGGYQDNSTSYGSRTGYTNHTAAGYTNQAAAGYTNQAAAGYGYDRSQAAAYQQYGDTQAGATGQGRGQQRNYQYAGR